MRRPIVLLAIMAACLDPQRSLNGPPDIAQLVVTPDHMSLAAGAIQQFDAYGRTASGDSVGVTVDFTATGGTITADGLFTAGPVAGTYQVIATQTGGSLADTASVTVTVSGPPTLAQIVLVPSAVTLAIEGTQQFSVYGRLSSGDSVAVGVTYEATGGTITAAGRYTAGRTAGQFRVMARETGETLADTASVVVVDASGGFVFVGAGDISDCGNDNDEATAQLLDAIPGTVYTTGDNVYSSGTAAQFSQCYDPTWGRHKARTRPAPGNHDYNTSGAASYYA